MLINFFRVFRLLSKKLKFKLIFFAGCMGILTAIEVVILYIITTKNSFTLIENTTEINHVIIFNIFILAIITKIFLTKNLLSVGYLSASSLINHVFKSFFNTSVDFDKSNPEIFIVEKSLIQVGILTNQLIVPMLNLITSLVTITIYIASAVFVISLQIILPFIAMIAAFLLIMLFVKQRLKVNTVKTKLLWPSLVGKVNKFGQLKSEIAIYGLSRSALLEISGVDRELRITQASSAFMALIPKLSLEILFLLIAVSSLMIPSISKNIVATNNEIAFLLAFTIRTFPSLNISYQAWARYQSEAQNIIQSVNFIASTSVAKRAEKLPLSQEEIRIPSQTIQFDWAKSKLHIEEISLLPGSITMLKGPSGLGKSSIMDILSGLSEAAVLQVEMLNSKVFTTREVYVNAAYCRQDSAVFDGSLRENITLNKELSLDEELRLKAIFSIIGIDDNDQKLLVKNELSGGQRKRISLARALFFSKNILFIDEAFSGLDDVATESIISGIRSSFPKLAILLVSHDAKIENFVDRISRIHQL